MSKINRYFSRRFFRKSTIKIINTPILDETFGFIIYNNDKNNNKIEFKRLTHENLGTIDEHLTHHLLNYYTRIRVTKICILIIKISKSEFYNMSINDMLSSKFPYINIQLSCAEIITENNDYDFNREIITLNVILRKLLNIITYVARMTRNEMIAYLKKHKMNINTFFRTRNKIGKEMLKLMLCDLAVLENLSKN